MRRRNGGIYAFTGFHHSKPKKPRLKQGHIFRQTAYRLVSWVRANLVVTSEHPIPTTDEIPMRRIQFIELHEQDWFPDFLRNDVTDTLQGGLNLSRAYRPIVPLLQRALESAGNRSIVDLCSGGGGPWLDLARKLKGKSAPLHISLTDKYPNAIAFENVRARSEIPISFYEDPVDARKVPFQLDGFRTMFTSFHHFAPDEARAIIQDAVDAKQGIGIFEITRRAPSAIILIVLWSFAPFVFTPFVRPFRWSRLLCTYIVPLIPFVLLFDGIISCLRTYRPSELRDLAGQLSESDYQWQAGEFRDSYLKLPVTFLIGYLRKS